MPLLDVRGATLSYDVQGTGKSLLLLPPAGTRSVVWAFHQVPALTAAGWRVVTVDLRGTPPSTVPTASLRLADLVADTAELITKLGLAPCRIVGASLGAMIAQELALARPDLVDSAVLLGTRCRTDYFRSLFACVNAARIRVQTAENLSDFEVLSSLLTMFSSRTLADDSAARDWFTVVRTFPLLGIGPASQYEASVLPDRTEALRKVSRPCLVIAFTEDSVCPPSLCREVADAIPHCNYVEIPDCGHFGFLESPDVVNTTINDFFTGIVNLSSLEPPRSLSPPPN